MFNRQRKLPVDTGRLKFFVSEALEILGTSRGCAVVLLSDAAMARVNARFAGVNSATDVLSFATSGGERRWDPNLGDILISVETADRQRRGSLEDELRILALHGLLHLLGYDHATDEGEMSRLERSLRGRLGLLAK